MLKIGLMLVLASMFAIAETPGARNEQQLAQALGFRCQTQFGICPIPPAPVGATCFCGNTPGQVIP
jgi:hypothetical protein